MLDISESSSSPIDSIDTPQIRVYNRRNSLLDEHDIERARSRAIKDEERRKENEERRRKRQLERESRRRSIQPDLSSLFSSGPSEEEKRKHAEEEHKQFIQKMRIYSTAKKEKDLAAETENKRQEAIRKLREQEEQEEEEERKRKEKEEELKKKKLEEEKKKEAERAEKALKIIMEDEEKEKEEEEEEDQKEEGEPVRWFASKNRRITDLLSESYAARPALQPFMPKKTASARNSLNEYAQSGDYKNRNMQEEEKQIMEEKKLEEYLKEQQHVASLPTESLKIYPYSVLIQPNLPCDVDVRRKEYHLSEDEFKRVFNMTRSKFESLPSWKRIQLRKSRGLF